MRINAHPRIPQKKDKRGSRKCACLICQCKIRCWLGRKICNYCQAGNHANHKIIRY